jgi:hypothetical protein
MATTNMLSSVLTAGVASQFRNAPSRNKIAVATPHAAELSASQAGDTFLHFSAQRKHILLNALAA